MEVRVGLFKKAKCRRIDAFELWCWRRLLRVPWTARRSNQSILKEINPEYSDAEPEALILWPPDAKRWLIWKDPDAGKGWKQEEKGMTEDEMVGWHRWLNGQEFEKTLGVRDGQGRLACCSPWGPKESDMTEWLNWYVKSWTKQECDNVRQCVLCQNNELKSTCSYSYFWAFTMCHAPC